MTNMKKLSVAVTLALSMGVASHASPPEIILKHNGKGDALLFPVYNAYVDNYFTISNNGNKWVQGHLRFRGAAWSGELLDMDIILSPGDVFVFRVADMDGDGEWELDQSLDPNNFKYTAYLTKCKSSVTQAVNEKNCMDLNKGLVPTTRNAVITDAIVDHHLKVGYIEFIGEAVLEGMDHDKMNQLLSDKPSADMAPYQTKQGNARGVTAWSWSDAGNRFRNDKGLSDVPNALSGTAFITLPGIGHGLAYNAEALVNFRTEMVNQPVFTDQQYLAGEHHLLAPAHRIDNYRFYHDTDIGVDYALDDDEMKIRANRAVIVHDENVSGPGSATPASKTLYRPYGDYVLRFEKTAGSMEDRYDETLMSFQNTWGPSLADGDDYELMGIRPTYGDPQDDDFDASYKDYSLPYSLGVPNSVAEVEEAIRQDGQTFTAYYFDGGELSESAVSLTSQYFAFFPTKVFWGGMYDLYKAGSQADYITQAVQYLLSKAKPYCLELWDNTEREACRAKAPEAAFGSPFVPGSGAGGSAGGASAMSGVSVSCRNPNATPCITVLGFELNFFDIDYIKSRFPDQKVSGIDLSTDFKGGKVILDPSMDANDPFQNSKQHIWPALMYTFELGDDWSISH